MNEKSLRKAERILVGGVHTTLIGLVRELPAPGPWEKSKKEGFMAAFNSTMNFIYPEPTEKTNKINDFPAKSVYRAKSAQGGAQ